MREARRLGGGLGGSCAGTAAGTCIRPFVTVTGGEKKGRKGVEKRNGRKEKVYERIYTGYGSPQEMRRT